MREYFAGHGEGGAGGRNQIAKKSVHLVLLYHGVHPFATVRFPIQFVQCHFLPIEPLRPEVFAEHILPRPRR
eukprot:4428794-Pyramimonas_sp.AAC.1